MIDRKLLKTNRWFDEEFLHARMTNACFNGGGGGDGGGADEDEAYEGEAMREYERDYGGDGAESQEIERQIAAQAAAQAQAVQQRANEFASAQQAQQQAAQQQAAQRANEFASAQQAQQQAAVQQQRANEFASAQQAQQQAAVARETTQMGMGPPLGSGAMPTQTVDTLSPGEQERINARQNIYDAAGTDFFGGDDVSGGFLDTTRSPSGFTGGGMMDYSDMTGLTQDDLSGQWGIGEGSRPAGYDYSGDMNLAMGHGYDQRFSGNQNHAWNQLSEQEKRNVVNREQQGPSGIAKFFNLGLDSRLTNLANSEIGNRVGPGMPGWDRDDSGQGPQWWWPDQTDGVIDPTVIPPGPTGSWSSCFVDGVQVELADGTEKNVAEISVGDVVKTQEGDGSVVKVFHSKAGKQKLYGFNDKEPFVTEAHPFMTQDGWKKVSELEVGDTLYRNGLGLDTVDSIESKEIPEDTPVYNFHVDKQENYYADGYLVHNKRYPGPGGGGGAWPPGGGGGMWPPGGGGGYPPGGGGGAWPPGGGGYPPTYGAGGRTGGGMPGYMANYPIHSQNLFNFTPARAMPGIDPSYQPWMQPAQGMDQNLWNYQAPNLLPWDMTDRVPWNFATTPTGQYGPMVSTVGGQPAEGGNRGDR